MLKQFDADGDGVADSVAAMHEKNLELEAVIADLRARLAKIATNLLRAPEAPCAAPSPP